MHELLELMMLDSSGLELQEDRDSRHYVIVSVLATMPALSFVSTGGYLKRAVSWMEILRSPPRRLGCERALGVCLAYTWLA